MRKRLLGFVLAAGAVAAPLAAAAPASAAAPKTFAAIVGAAKLDPGGLSGTIRIQYRCTTEDHTSPHSFVSVKQVGSRKLDRNLSEEGSSALAVGSGGAWAMSHRNPMNCDSKVHTQTFSFDQVETSSFGVPVQPFAKGWGYVQFCIFDDNYPIPAPPADPESGQPYDQTAFRLVTQ
jgi:hypothetical protein